MNNCYHLILECPKCHENISLQRKSPKLPPSEEITCLCSWRGRAGKTKLRRVVPFNWIYSKAS